MQSRREQILKLISKNTINLDLIEIKPIKSRIIISIIHKEGHQIFINPFNRIRIKKKPYSITMRTQPLTQIIMLANTFIPQALTQSIIMINLLLIQEQTGLEVVWKSLIINVINQQIHKEVNSWRASEDHQTIELIII